MLMKHAGLDPTGRPMLAASLLEPLHAAAKIWTGPLRGAGCRCVMSVI
jgi:hypothetical protein